MKIMVSMGLGDWWRKPRKKSIGEAALATIMTNLQAQEQARKASRPKMTLPGGEKFYFEEDDMGRGWWWTSDGAVSSEPGGRQLSLIMLVDNQGELPSADLQARRQEVLGHLPDRKKRLPEVCLEFDFDEEGLELAFDTLQG